MSSSAANIDAARPMLRRDVHFADIGDGVFLRHSDDSMVLKGAVIYRWVATLAPYLTGEATVAELTADLSTDQHEMAQRVIGALLDRGFARITRPSETKLSNEVSSRFGAQLRYIEHFADDAAARFTRFHHASIRVLAGTSITQSCTATLIINGAAHVQSVAELQDADLVIASTDQLGLGGLLELAEQAQSAGVAILPVLLWDGVAYVGPVIDSKERAGLRSLYWRLTGNLAPESRARFWETLAATPNEPTRLAVRGPAAMIGSLLAYETFRYLTGCLDAETLGHVVVQDLDTLDSHTERLLPHPAERLRTARQARSVVADADELVSVLNASASRDVPREDQEMRAVADAAMPLISHQLGVFGTIDDREITQSPLKAARLSLREGERRGSATIIGTSVHTPMEARMRALLDAAATYALHWAPRQFEWDAEASPQDWQLWNGVPVDVSPATDADDLNGGRVRIPRSVLFPLEDGASREVVATDAGTGAGFTTAEAVRTSLLSALAHQSLQEALRGEPAVEIDQRGLEGPTVRFLIRAHQELGVRLRIAALQGVVPTVMVEANDPHRTHIALAAGLNLDEALATALEESLAAWQFDDESRRKGGDPSLSSLNLTDGEAPLMNSSWADVVGQVAPIVIDITPEDLRGNGIVVARVLLARRTSEN